MKPIVSVQGLKTYFRTLEGLVRAVDEVSFDLFPGEILAIVGESGSGKSVCVRSLLGLHASHNVELAGSVRYGDRDLLPLKPDEWRSIRGREIGMIFQEPMSSFDPLYTVGEQAIEAYTAHFPEVGTNEAKGILLDEFRGVRIPEAERRFDDYAHQLSGGMLQRIMIAVALSLRPAVLIADEPTTALDVTIQAQILNLMKNLQRERETAIIFITHDLGVVSQIADRVIVMYAGKVVEHTDVETLNRNPAHPYTRGLLASRVTPAFKGRELPSIRGVVPRPVEFPQGCRFHPRCDHAFERCTAHEPPPFVVDERADSSDVEHTSACWLNEIAAADGGDR